MKLQPKRPLKKNLSSLKRVMRVSYLGGLAGTFLQRQGIRMILPSALVTLGLAYKFSTGDNDTSFVDLYKAASPMLLPAGMITAGIGCKVIPPLLLGMSMAGAEDNGARLLSNERWSRFPLMLEELIDKVYYPHSVVHHGNGAHKEAESNIGWQRHELYHSLDKCLSSDSKDWLQLDDDNLDEAVETLSLMYPITSGIERCKEGLRITLLSSINKHDSAGASYLKSGYDVSLELDWLNSAPFSQNDKTIQTQIDTNPKIRVIKDQLKHSKMGPRLEKHESLFYDIKTAFTCGVGRKFRFREVTLRAYHLLQNLKKVHKDAPQLSLESILRPDEADGEYVGQFEGLGELIKKGRREIMHSVYGTTADEAKDTVDRMTLHAILRATALRIKYDPFYAGSESLPNNFVDDLAKYTDKDQTYFEDLSEQIRSEQRRFESSRFCPSDCNSLEHQALSIAYHINYKDIRTCKSHLREPVYDTNGTIGGFVHNAVRSISNRNRERKKRKNVLYKDAVIAEVRENATLFDDCLLELRKYQTMTMFARDEHLRLVMNLGEYETSHT